VLRSVITIFAAILISQIAVSAALAERKVAFVVGIDKYDNLGQQQQLQRAVNDARSVAGALASLGFEVVRAENVGRGAFNAMWQKFLDKVQPGDTAAIYYSGHGVEIEGLNFLLPRDLPNISYGRQEQLKRESLSVSELLLDLRRRKPQVTLVILDACRDHPLTPPENKSLAWGGGLARMDAPTGTFIMYSAGVGETALDRLPGDDPDKVNSVYTRKLLPLVKTPGIPLHELARRLRLEVHNLAAAVPHVQQPAYYDGLIGKFCLAGCDVADATKPDVRLVLKPGMVVPGDLPPPVQRCIAAQGERKPWEYDWAKCGVATEASAQPATPTYFRCSMKGGVMDGKVYSFSIDTAGKKAAWAEYGIPLDIVHLDDLRIHTSTKLRISGWPEHDHVGFNFNRLTLIVDGALSRVPSSVEISECRAKAKGGWSGYCDSWLVVASSSGTCEVIARPEDVAGAKTQRPTVPKPGAQLETPISGVQVETKVAIPTGVEHLVCEKPQQPDAPKYSLELVNDATGNVSEIHVPADYGTRRYRVTKATAATYAAEELDPKAPDAVGSLFLDRLTGDLTTTNRISFAAVDILVKFCDGQLSKDACLATMENTKGGNPFECFDTKKCESRRNKSNVLAVHYDICRRAEKKF